MLGKLRSFKRYILNGAMAQKGLKRKLKYLQYAMIAYKEGVVSFRIDRLADEYTDIYFDYPYASKADKEWFASKGFGAYKMQWYGMTRENYGDFISDFVFYNKRNYKNKEFESWFENKLNTYYLLAPFKESMPKHYYYIEKSAIYPLDVDNKHMAGVRDILELVKSKPIAAKATIGGHGVGFYKLEYDGSNYIANGTKYTEAAFGDLINNLSGYIITDYGIPHHFYSELTGPNTFAVMRAYVVFDDDKGPQLVASTIRLGTKKAGYVTDYPGTLYCGIDTESGTMFNPIYFEREYVYKHMKRHPDTGKELEGIVVPDWDNLKTLVKKVSAYLPVTPYLVMDLIPTENGFAILEINSHGQLRTCEAFYPAMKNPYLRKIFDNK
ncbi:MAG: sugar-transfer associated ATP-grasp domain-containing protein [Candidatus Ornithomonoglobus sp.]